VASGRQLVEPPFEQPMQRLFPDSNRRVRHDEIEAEFIGNVIRTDRRNREAESFGIGRTQPAGPLIDVDGPHLGLGGSQRSDAGDWAIAAPDIENDSAGLGLAQLEQQESGASVDLVSREHPTIDIELNRDVREVQGNAPHRTGNIGLFAEVVPGHRPPRYRPAKAGKSTPPGTLNAMEQPPCFGRYPFGDGEAANPHLG